MTLLGLGIVRVLLGRENIVVFAGARKSSPELESLASQHSGKLHIVQLTSGDEADNKAAVRKIQRIVGRLDVVIANAAIGAPTGSAMETSAQDMAEHFAVNTIGPLVLFQATYPLLKASSDAPKFIPVSSVGGTVARGATLRRPTLAYGASKAALNYLSVKLRADHENLSRCYFFGSCMI